MASAASAAVSFAWPYTSCSFAWPYTSCSVPSICLALPWTCVFTSPVARPNPSSTCPPTFLAVPPRRSVSASLLLSCGARERTAAILLIAPALRLAAARSFHSHSGGENAESEQRNEPAPADHATRLNCTRNQLRVEPNRLFARGERHLGPFNSSAPRLQTANDCDDRDQQEYPGEYRRCDQRPVAFRRAK